MPHSAPGALTASEETKAEIEDGAIFAKSRNYHGPET